jgi:outer membrane lipoprotein carrier protein
MAFLLATGGAWAATDPGLERLQGFLQTVNAMEGSFSQEVLDARGTVVETSSGTVQLQRPGRFRWDYRDPFERVIVADGERIWLYEADLEQVTIRRLDEGIGDTPAALITGRSDVLARFDFQRSWRADGLLWVALAPKARDTDFAAVRLGFDGDRLVRLELDDRLGQQTRLRFRDVRLNPPVAPDAFRFAAPPGVDVIDESEL